MKRLFTYILALSLLPQITSAAVVVGKTEGTFAVSHKGAATYTIPLTIMKGMSDFKPELSLFYDSNAESGIMGQGWSIKGMHTITKVPKCIHFDGTSQGTAYALDGMRMILGIGVDGQIGALYKTEHDQGDIISITAAQNGTPTTFKVKANDGSIYKYGSSTGRYINGDNSKWALDYAQDALGNYISYTYDQNGGLYPTSITYGRNIHGTAGVDCTILFTYDDSTPKRLTKITCKYNENIYRSYTFNYADSPSHLTSVTEGGRSTTTFAPTTFEWAQNRISSITDGLGATESFTYCSLNEDASYSGWPAIKNPPRDIFILQKSGHANIKKNIYVVKSKTDFITTDSRTTNYSYTRGVYDNEGKGFLGFGAIKGESTTGIDFCQYYNVDSLHSVLLPECVEYTDGWGYNNALSTSSIDANTYRTEKTTNGIGLRIDACTDAEIRYYSNGLPYGTDKWTDFIETKDRTIRYWESPNDTIMIKGLPLVKETQIRTYWADEDGDDTYEETEYVRDPSTGLVLKETKKRKKYGGNYCITSTDGYSYNEYGQVIRHWTVAFNDEEVGDTLVTTYEYNAKGQLSKENTPLGQEKTYSYNAYTGMLAKVYGINSAGTAYTYDNMLREIKRENNLILTNTSWNYANYGDATYSIKVAEVGKAPVTTYYDAWGRKVAESTQHAYITTYTDYKYLPNGKVGFVSFPHKSNETDTLGTSYFYDYWARLERTEDSNGKVNTWEYTSYYDDSYETNIDGVPSYIYYVSDDVLGTVISDNTYTDYFYNTEGNLYKIKTYFKDSNESKETFLEFDIYGRLARSTDMNGVTKEYTYDANGYPKKITIGDSFVETNYDKYGRLLSKTWKEANEDPHTVTYTYNTEKTKKHLVAQEQGDNYTYTYTYNQYGKLSAKHHSVTNDANTEYANIDILFSAKYLRHISCIMGLNRNRSVTEAFGYTYNELRVDSLNGSPIWRIASQDKWGNAVSTTGLRGTTNYVFDDYGHTLSMERKTYFPINKTYSYDLQTGNMVKKDSVLFTYDNVNRLTGWGDHEYSYDKRGNITIQPHVGEYTYNEFRVEDMVEAEDYTNDDSLSITYYKSIERPKSIENKHYKAEFSYDGDGNRILMKVYKKVSGQYQPYLTRYYLGENVEVNIDSVGNKTGFFYANGDAQTASSIMVVKPNSTLLTKWRLFRDNTGNVFRYENSNTNYYDFSYNPWGVRTEEEGDSIRFYKPGESLGDCPFYRTYRGYEDLWMFGLLLDKTRLYDPYQGRYLSPDPVYNISNNPYDANPYIFSKNNPFKKY